MSHAIPSTTPSTTHLPVVALVPHERARFVTRTYLHLFGAILAFVAVEVALFSSGLAQPIAESMLGVSWLMVLGAFMIVGVLASRMAHSAASPLMQYLALGLYVLAEAVIFVPLLFVAEYYFPGVIGNAAAITISGFLALTFVAITSAKDFSFLRTAIMWGGLVGLGLIVLAIVVGFELGLLFSVAMIALAGAAILYNTSQVLYHYPADRHVAASLELFASVALMFWYVLRLTMAFSR